MNISHLHGRQQITNNLCRSINSPAGQEKIKTSKTLQTPTLQHHDVYALVHGKYCHIRQDMTWTFSTHHQHILTHIKKIFTQLIIPSNWLFFRSPLFSVVKRALVCFDPKSSSGDVMPLIFFHRGARVRIQILCLNGCTSTYTTLLYINNDTVAYQSLI